MTKNNYFNHYISTETEKEVSNILWTNSNLRTTIEEQISMINVLKDIKEANLTNDMNLKKKITDKIIQVGEYKIIN